MYKTTGNKGFTLIELLVVIAIIGILAAASITTYIGANLSADRSDAYSQLNGLRMLEEQFLAENGVYTVSVGVCAPNNPLNVAAIQAVLPGFQPGLNTNFSYCIQQDMDLAGAATAPAPCFRAEAWGNAGTRVAGDSFMIDCNNATNF